MINQARPYIYTTAAPPLLAHTLLASLDLISGEAWRRERLAAHIALFRLDPDAPSLTALGRAAAGTGEAYGFCLKKTAPGEPMTAALMVACP